LKIQKGLNLDRAKIRENIWQIRELEQLLNKLKLEWLFLQQTADSLKLYEKETVVDNTSSRKYLKPSLRVKENSY
jgi:phenylalanine-4-hydroxylase